MSAIDRLQQWYTQQCDGEWEHGQGISIQTLDNPGWWVKIDLKGTKLQQASFRPIEENVNEQGFQFGERWLRCQIRNGCWEGAGDETRLPQIVNLFLDWAESIEK
jgi:hypothetical protein